MNAHIAVSANAAPVRRGSAVGRTARRFLRRTWLAALLIAIWAVWSAAAQNPFFPSVVSIVEDIGATWFTLRGLENILVSLTNLLLGFFIAAAFGIFGGIALWRFPRTADAVFPLIYFWYVIPTVAILPILIALLGLDTAMKIATIVLAAVWPALLNTLDGMRSVDSVKLDVSRVMRMSAEKTVRMIVVPNALPQIFAGLKHSLQVSVILMVVSELIGSTSGMGFMILEAQQAFRFVTVWSGAVLLAALGGLLTVLFDLVERRVLRWYLGAREMESKR